jgi:hypothetical protein
MSLVPSFLQLLQPFESLMTAPTFASLVTVLTGWTLCRRHTVTGALAAVGDYDKHYCAYHRLFAAARWDVEAVGLALAGMVLGTFAAATGGVVFLVVDDTLCRKRGRKVFGAGMHYDAAATGRRLSNANRSIKSRGHCWVMLGVVVAFGFRPGHYYCLPLLSRLYLNHNSAKRHGRAAYRTKPQLASEMLGKLCAAFPAVRFHLLADSGYGGQHLLGDLPANCELTCRWILNAALYAPAPPRAPGATGRRRVRGDRLPGVAEMLAAGRCQRLDLDLYGQRRSQRVGLVRACFHALPGKLLTVVAAEPLSDAGTPRPGQRAVFYSTVTDATAEQVLTWYARRWSVEVTIRDAKQQLGLAQPQGRTERAVRRAAPTLLLMYSLVVLWFAQTGHGGWRPPRHAWHAAKRHASFADMLAALRQQILRQQFRGVVRNHGGATVSRNAIKSLVRLVKQAA